MKTHQETYDIVKERLLQDSLVCLENRSFFKRFFEYEEHKLKRLNSLSKLDSNCYKTLISYIYRFRNVNRWFDNKPWKDLTEEDLRRVYNDLEDGVIKRKDGKPLKDKKTYYKMILRSKPFEMIGKRELMKQVMEFMPLRNPDEVRFIEEESFRKMVAVVRDVKHKLFLWLYWDIGENGGALIQLTKKDFTRQINKDTKEPEYLVNLRKEILKRSRTSRTEITNYKETAELLDIVLNNIHDENEIIFNFGLRMAHKIVADSAEKNSIRCIPAGQKVTMKDLRSSMACNLLDKGWSTDDINARLGHKPSSKVMDKYISFRAIKKRNPKRTFYNSTVEQLTEELENVKNAFKISKMSEESKGLELENIKKELLILKSYYKAIFEALDREGVEYTYPNSLIEEDNYENKIDGEERKFIVVN